MSDSNRVDWLVPAALTVPLGCTNVTFVPIKAGQVYVDLLPTSGGSVFISGFGISRGFTTSFSGGTLAPSFFIGSTAGLVNGLSGFPLSWGQVPYRVNGPAAFWLSAAAATTIVNLAYGCRSTNSDL